MKHVHFIGIGGSGTSGLAELLLSQGAEVSGSDLARSAKIEALEKLGARITIGHRASNIPSECELVVYSSAVQGDNEEFMSAIDRHIRTVRRANFMGEILEGHRTIAVAGTHGKTTTASMIAAVLIEAKLDPLVLIGGSVRELGNKNSRAGSGTLALVEADEYDRSFLTLKPYIGVVTSLEPEHLDIYEGIEDLQQTFTQFLNQGASGLANGYAVLCIDEPFVRAITPRLEKKIVAYGIESQEAKYRASDIIYAGIRTKARIWRGSEVLGDLELNVPGEHNVKNALAAIAIGEILSIPYETTRKALRKFSGAERRFDIKGNVSDVLVIDDYAHHPTEVRAILQTIRNSYPNRRILAAFQPHTFTRTRDFSKEFGKALGEWSDLVMLLDIYPSREQPIEGITSDLIEQSINENSRTPVIRVALPDELAKRLQSIMLPGDIVVTIGAGTITEAAPEIVEVLRARSTKETEDTPRKLTLEQLS